METQQQTPAQHPPVVYSPSEFDERGAAAFLRLSVKTLQGWRLSRAHLTFHKRGGRIYYKTADLQAFLDSGRIEPRP